MKKRLGRIAVSAGLVAGSAVAAEAAGPATDVAALEWMAGRWEGTTDGVAMEEHWLPARGGAMLGVHRDVAGGRMVSFEFLRIESDAQGIVYLASPKGRPATPFRLVESGKARAVFANPQHDFPERILYWLGEDGSLHARIEGNQGGKPASEEWAWKRVK
jgi:uncharacterized protein DUF6265